MPRIGPHDVRNPIHRITSALDTAGGWTCRHLSLQTRLASRRRARASCRFYIATFARSGYRTKDSGRPSGLERATLFCILCGYFMWGAGVAAPRYGREKVHNRRLISLALFMLVLATFGLGGCGQGPKGDPGQPGLQGPKGIRASPVHRVRLVLPVLQGRKANRGLRVRAYGSCATTALAENVRPRAAAMKFWSVPIAGRRTIRRRSLTSGRSRAASK